MRAPTPPTMLLTLPLLMWPALAGASAPDLFGYGARGQALAGATISSPEGHAAVYYNPAALAFDRTPSIAIGYQFATLDLTLDGAPHPARDATATIIGFDLPLPLGGPLTDRISLGGAFVIPTNSVLVADIPRPGDPTFALVSNRAQTVTLQAAVGVQPVDGLAIGAGFIALSALDGAIDVAPNAEGRIGSQARDQLVADYAPVLSVALRLPATLTAGAVWRGVSQARFYLPITADLGTSFPLPVPTLQIEGVAQYDPEQLGFEVAGAPLDGLRLAAGGTFKRWSRFPIPIVYTAVPEGSPAQPPPEFDDAWEARAAAEWTGDAGPATWAGRLGYQLAWSPAPEQTGLHNHLDSDRHLLALGGGLRWQGLRLDVALQWHLMAKRRHTKDPEQITAAGYDPETHPGAEGLRHDGQIIGAAIELGVDL